MIFLDMLFIILMGIQKILNKSFQIYIIDNYSQYSQFSGKQLIDKKINGI